MGATGRRTVWGLAAAAALLVLGCSSAGESRVTGLTGTGVVEGFLLVDANGSRQIESSDDSFPGHKVRLVLNGRPDSGLAATSQSNGFFRFRDVPLGVYALKVDTTGFADTLSLVKVDSASFTVAASDTAHVNVLVGLPLLTVREARAAAPGRHVFVTAVALASASDFADSTTAVADTSGSIRVARARTIFTAGDSVRLLGITGVRDSEPVLGDPTVFALGTGRLPNATLLSTAVAAGADSGRRDAQLVSIKGATVSDTSRTPSSFIVTVSDGSGALQLQLDQPADNAFLPGALPGPYVPGNEFDVVGVLLPTGTGSWRLRPRSANDLTPVPAPVLSIRAVRALAPGTIATVVGVALNSSTTYSDTTVFLADTSGAIRLTRLRSNVTAGDSIKVRATTATRDSEPTLDGGTVTALGQGFFPAAPAVTTAKAADADSGKLDAHLVIVDSAAIKDTATVLGNYQLTVNDSSGNLVVTLDRAIPFQVPGTFVPGNSFRLVGILVPDGTGKWTLKPRSPADVQKF